MGFHSFLMNYYLILTEKNIIILQSIGAVCQWSNCLQMAEVIINDKFVVGRQKTW